MARQLEADHIINVEKADAVKRMMELTNGREADIVIETSCSGAQLPSLLICSEMRETVCDRHKFKRNG